MREIFEAAFENASQLLNEIRASNDSLDALSAFVSDLVCSLKSGATVLVAGNGGSMADAMHFAEEWTGRFRKNRQPYPVMALSDPTYLTCVGNDFGFEEIIARGVQAFGKPNGLLLLLTTSGNSENLILAARSAQKIGMQSWAFTGRGGGKLQQEVDRSIDFPGETSDRIQELQMLALHASIEAAEELLARDSG